MHLDSRPILFLDFDDVVCLNRPYGGYDAMQALSGERADSTPGDLWSRLFDADCAAWLWAVHQRHRPRYVLSTSWTGFMDLGTLEALLARTRMDFVGRHLHADWDTPKPGGATRAEEIGAWLLAHPEVTRSVVLDDVRSGTGLVAGQAQAVGPVGRPHVVLCRENVGLDEATSAALDVALQWATGGSPLRSSPRHL